MFNRFLTDHSKICIDLVWTYTHWIQKSNIFDWGINLKNDGKLYQCMWRKTVSVHVTENCISACDGKLYQCMWPKTVSVHVMENCISACIVWFRKGSVLCLVNTSITRKSIRFYKIVIDGHLTCEQVKRGGGPQSPKKSLVWRFIFFCFISSRSKRENNDSSLF